jgi:hypothetical protein
VWQLWDKELRLEPDYSTHIVGASTFAIEAHSLLVHLNARYIVSKLPNLSLCVSTQLTPWGHLLQGHLGAAAPCKVFVHVIFGAQNFGLYSAYT